MLMRNSIVAIAAAVAVFCCGEAQAKLITVIWSAEAVTVVKKPFGLTIPLNTVVTGTFRFDTATPDSDPNPLEGAYQHSGNSGFTADLLGNEVTGSDSAFYEVDLDQDPTIDTFRIYDGPRVVGHEGGVMAFNGTEDENIQLFFAATEDVFTNDHLIDPFPEYDYGFLGTPHTFTLQDLQGEVLMQLTGAAEAVCGDPTGGGVSAGDALQVLRASVGIRACLDCVCDVDSSGSISATDALKVLRFAVSGKVTLTCPACS